MHQGCTTLTSPENPEILACKETRKKRDIAIGYYCFILLRSLQICVFWLGPKFYILLQAGSDSVRNFNLFFWPGRTGPGEQKIPAHVDL